MLSDPKLAAQWLRERVTGVLRTDSRLVQPGDAFIAWPGAAADGRAFVTAALRAGASAVLLEDAGADAFAASWADQADRVLRFAGLKAAAGLIAAAYFDQPSSQLKVLAVTGTNGKTSTSWWLAQALSALPGAGAMPAGLVGTLGIGRAPALGLAHGTAKIDAAALQYTGLTTPDPVALQAALRQFVSDGVRALAIEASSIGIEEQRLAGLQIDVALFTNFTQDHLDYHGSMEAYWEAKRRLFAWPGLRAAVINIDDAFGARLAEELRHSHCDVWTVSLKQAARLQAFNIRYTARGVQFDVHDGDDEQLVSVPLIGDYNVANVLSVMAALRSLGVSLAIAAYVCSRLQPVPGRMECLGGEGQPLVAVDYAHTPDALLSALQALRPMAAQRGGRLWCVFGCGGDRDASKRPLMGGIAAQWADRAVVTSDNPRSESAQSIIDQIVKGVSDAAQLVIEPDRAQAIARALAGAQAADIVLIAGKGHESTQDIGGVKLPFSDAEHAAQALATWQAPPQLTLKQVAAWLRNAHWVGAEITTALRVHTDSRSLQPGDLFVALKGETFDANQFLHQAQERGAVAVVCQAGLDAARYPVDLPRIEVPDTRVALGQLAAAWRAQFKLPVIAVTGSNGKTTVTQMLASILNAHAPNGTALATRGNLNNDIGVPLTLLRLQPDHRIAVVELGMNHPGEIAVLAAMAQPTVALVNNAQREHLEFMHTVQAVAEENGAVLQSLPADGVAVFPSDDEFTPLWTQIASPRRCVGFADQAPAADGQGVHCLVAEFSEWRDGAWLVQARWVPATNTDDASETPSAQTLQYRLHIAGRHNVRNSLAAAQCALAAGVSPEAVVRGLETFTPVKGRSRALSLTLQGVAHTVVDDTYNANPDSVRAAIEVLRELPAGRLLVLGDMGEVGQQGPEFHAEAGRHALAAGIEQVFCIGELTRHVALEFPQARHFDSMEALCAAVLQALPSVASVLVKGSRFMRMEQVVTALESIKPLASVTATSGSVSGEKVCC